MMPSLNSGLALDFCLVRETEICRRKKTAAAIQTRIGLREKPMRITKGSDREPSDSFESVRFDSRSPNPPREVCRRLPARNSCLHVNVL
jgi:hypothetical protein